MTLILKVNFNFFLHLVLHFSHPNSNSAKRNNNHKSFLAPDILYFQLVNDKKCNDLDLGWTVSNVELDRDILIILAYVIFKFSLSCIETFSSYRS